MLSHFLRDHPDVNIDLREVLSGEIVKGVADSATDIGIVAGNVHSEHLEMLPYRDDRLVLVTSCDHPLAKQPSVDFAQVLDANFVSLPTSSAIHAFCTLWLPPSPSMVVTFCPWTDPMGV